MRVSELKRLHEQHNPQSHFFSRNTMKFCGDTMASYGLSDGGDVWVLRRLRKSPKGFLPKAWIFSKETFALIHRPG
jgi:hypothetical protein